MESILLYSVITHKQEGGLGRHGGDMRGVFFFTEPYILNFNRNNVELETRTQVLLNRAITLERERERES